MNKERRAQIDEVKAKLEAARGILEEAQGMAEGIRDDEQGYYDNMPESLQNGEKGERAQAAVDALEDATSGLGELLDGIDNATSNLETAAE